MVKRYDAVIVGSGPNGLGAAITIARAGHSVLVLECAETIGGGMRSAELTLPGFTHDVCSAVHPLGISSPLFRSLPLADHGLEWVQPSVPLAHPFDDGTAAILHRSIEETALQFPRDAGAYRGLLAPIVRDWRKLARETLRPIVHIPKYPVALARFGLPSLRSASGLASGKFRDPRLRALFAGNAAHAIVPLEKPFTASFGLVMMASAHRDGWPSPKGGSQQLANALASYFRSLGGEIETRRMVRTMADLPPHRTVIFDVSPESLLEICGDELDGRYRRRIMGFRRGEGAFKVDYALSRAVPWKAEGAREAGTLHLGGSFEGVVASERAANEGHLSSAPLVLAAQTSVFDDTRAPDGKHTLWAYCHTPHGSTADRAADIERQIERFAPGFRDVVLARTTMNGAQMEAHNPNLVGGDIAGGSNGGMQLFFRPGFSLRPYNTPIRGVYLCSASTPPGGGVHGMCGYRAARAALSRELR